MSFELASSVIAAASIAAISSKIFEIIKGIYKEKKVLSELSKVKFTNDNIVLIDEHELSLHIDIKDKILDSLQKQYLYESLKEFHKALDSIEYKEGKDLATIKTALRQIYMNHGEIIFDESDSDKPLPKTTSSLKEVPNA